MSKETIKVVEINTDPAKKSIKDLRKELLELKNQMTNLEEGSDAFGELSNKAGELKHQLDEINESVKGASADFGDMVGNISNVAAGITGAFQAVAGGLQAMGLESKAIDETIKSMQGLMAVTQGLSSIDTAIKSLDKLQHSIKGTTAAAKLLKSALQPKVFLAISAAVAGITAIFSRWKKQEDEVAEAVKKRAEALKQIEMDKLIREQKEYNDTLSAQLSIQQAYYQGLYGGDKKKELQATITEYEKVVKQLEAPLPSGMQKKLEALEEEIAKYTEADQEYWNLLIDITNVQAEIENFNKKPESEQKRLQEIYDNYYKQLQDLKLQLQIIKAIEKGKKDALPKPDAIQGKVTTIDVKPVVLPLTDEDKERIKKLIDDALQAAAEERLKKLNEIEGLGNSFFNGLKESTDNFADSTLGITTGWIAGLDQFQEAFLNVMSTIKESGEMTWTDYANVSAMALNGVGTMLNALSNEQDASTKEGFEKMKKLQIAATTINMLAGITAALSGLFTTKTGPWDIVLASIQAATIAATGALQISKIKNTTMEGANPNTNINAKSVSSMIVPPVQYSNAVQGAELNGNIQNTKVYVLESEIVDTIGKVSVQESENTY